MRTSSCLVVVFIFGAFSPWGSTFSINGAYRTRSKLISTQQQQQKRLFLTPTTKNELQLDSTQNDTSPVAPDVLENSPFEYDKNVNTTTTSTSSELMHPLMDVTSLMKKRKNDDKSAKKGDIDITADLSFLDGAAKVEEPGDREKIMNSIKKYQFDLWKNEPRIPFATLLQRTLDTAEDIFLHLRRVPYDIGWKLEPELEDRPTIVVLGSGWAAHAFLKVADTYKLRVIVVSPTNHFVFTPMLASASVGTVEYRSMTEAVRAANPMIENYLEGKAVDIDLEQKTIKVQLESLLQGLREGEPPLLEISYDKLIVAVGCKVADTLVPGAFENSLRLKSCDDARR
jgi:hypothetical protein